MKLPKGLHGRKNISLTAMAVVIVLAVGGFLLYQKFHNNLPTDKTPYKSIEVRSAPYTQKDLDKKDYVSYQTRLSTSANDYIASGHFSDAERVLSEIVNNVPTDKINSQTYRAYWYFYQQKGDVQNRKKYALLTAEKLKAEGQYAAAADFEKDGKSN